MFNYSSASLSDNGFCNKYSLFAALSKLDTRLCIMKANSVANANQHPVVRAEEPSVAPVGHPLVVPARPGQQAGCQVAVPKSRRRRQTKPTGDHHSSVYVSNSYSQFGDTTLMFGDSIVRNVKIARPATIAKCIPGATVGDLESHLKLLTIRINMAKLFYSRLHK